MEAGPMHHEALYESKLEGVPFVTRGKVRDMYRVGENLLIVASDRLSAFDFVLPTPIPGKGKVLTALSLFWFDLLSDITPNHLVTAEVEKMGEALQPHADVLRGRSMLVRTAEVLPVECVVRGYLAGSGWKSYQDSGTVCGIQLPAGLKESDKLPEPLFTPATKAEHGEHDENISFLRMCDIIGEEVAQQVRERSLAVYQKASEYAATRGIILCDTKFEWGFIDGQLSLVDEVLTPDSSRFWPADQYEPGGPQPSYDKQYVRDWLEASGWNKQPPPPELPDEVVRRTSEKYLEAHRLLTGRDLEI
jgi:phosphoribosylaminoimidazole-succinocarboxamide synthase